MSDLATIGAVNARCPAFYVERELAKEISQVYEFNTVANTTFGGVKERLGLEDGEEWKVLGMFGHESVEETVAEMDRVGVDRMFVDDAAQWSHHDTETTNLCSIEHLAQMRDESDGRLIPGLGYDPYDIRGSLDRIERAFDDLDFGYIWFHPMTYGMKPTDERCYPLYTKAEEMGIPVSFQTGHSAEPLPSSPGRPMYADQVAMDFPDLDIVLTHSGWPWTEEWCSMLWRFPNVYGCFGAYYPSFLPERQVEFMNGKIRHKVMWQTNGLDLERHKQEMLDLPVSEETKEQVLRENAAELYGLDL